MSDTVKVKINDIEYEFPAGLTILEAANEIGVEIPHFCWHKHLSISGNCRMCLVEVKPGPPKPSIACATRIANGMDIQTETERIRKARRGVLEFLLLNHPLDCPVCDEAYECRLQDYTHEYGASVSRFLPFHDKKRMHRRIDLGKMFVEMNRCIGCTRCVRFLKEIAGEYELERTERGHKLKIHTYKKAFESDFALNAADLCPVGALEDKKFRFKARNWDLVKVPSICPSCSIGCNVTLGSLDGKLVRIEPRENEDVNACWICDYGRHNYDFIHENRIDTPHLRADADLQPATFEAAVEEAGKRLEEIRNTHGGEAIGLLLSPWMTNEELYLGKKLAALLGTGRVGVLAGYNHRPVVPVMSDILPKTLVSDDKSPNGTGARLMKIHEGDEEFTYGHELIAAIEGGKVNGMILFHEDIAERDGFDPVAVRKALAYLDFLLVISWRPTHVGSQAGVILPSLTYAEKDGSFTNHSRRVQRIRRAVGPLEGARGELEILTLLGRRFDPEFGFTEPRDAFFAMAAEEPAFAGLTWADLGESGVLIEARDE